MMKSENKDTVAHSIFSNLGRLEVVECGNGPQTLVLWPSVFTDHKIYSGLVERLPDQYRYLLIDGPGHGGSDGPTEEFSMAQCADALAAVLDHFGLETAIVGGTSWGGLVAAHFVLSAPERAQALILLNTPMEIDENKQQLSSRLIAFGARWMLRTKLFRNGVANSFFSMDAQRRNEAYMSSFHDMLKGAEAVRLSTAIRSVMLRGEPLKKRMHEIQIPTLVIAGEDDAMYPTQVQADAADRAPKGRFALVPGKHISAVECADEVADLIRDHLAKIELAEAVS